MPHPSRVLPQKNVIQELLDHDTPRDALLAQDSLLRLICTQQLRLEQSLFTQTERVLDHLNQRAQHRVRSVADGEPYQMAYKQGEACPQKDVKPLVSARFSGVTPRSGIPYNVSADPDPEVARPPAGVQKIRGMEALTVDGFDSARTRSGRELFANEPRHESTCDTSSGPLTSDAQLGAPTDAGNGTGPLHAARLPTPPLDSGPSPPDFGPEDEGERLDEWEADRSWMETSRRRRATRQSETNEYWRRHSANLTKKKSVEPWMETITRRIEQLSDCRVQRLLLYGVMIFSGFTARVSWIVRNPWFDTTAALFIVFNSMLIAWQVEWAANNDEEHPAHFIGGHICNVYFTIELILRMLHLGRGFFMNEDKWWNIFDMFLVGFAIFEMTSGAEEWGAGSSMKTLKMVRVIRIFRVFRFSRELSLMALMIAESLRSLVWAWCLITIIMFTFAVCITQATIFYLKEGPTESLDDVALARKYFGSISRTIYSLTQAMLGGKSWGEYTDVLLYVDIFAVSLFLLFIVFMMIAVLNVITGVFVDNAVAAASKQREFVISQEMSQTRKIIDDLSVVFEQIDKDGSGDILIDEARRFFSEPAWAAYFAAMGIDTTDIEALFDLLDYDGNGAVPFPEFITGCLRLKGNAKRIDSASILAAMERVEDKLELVLTGRVNSDRKKKTKYLMTEPSLGFQIIHENSSAR